MAGGVGFRDPIVRLWACDWQTPLAEIDTYERATLIARYNEISTYELVLPAATEAAQLLLAADRPRLLIFTDEVVYRSGPVTRIERTRDATTDMVTLNGVDDLVWLSRRLAHPQPGTAAPPYSASAYDSQTGPASQVIAGYVNRNAGPLAIAARQVPGLTVPTPAAFGGTVTTSARYQGLLAFLQPIAAAAKVGIRVRDLAFEVFQPTGSAVFNVGLGTLASWQSALEAPDLNYVYVAGAGELTARLIREYQDTNAVLQWGRVETFVDRRDTSATAELDQAAAEALADGVRPIMATLEVMNTDGQQFLRDWNVGDLATVVVGDLVTTDVIVEAQIDLLPNRPLQVRPTVGASALTLAQWRLAQRQAQRLRQLERI